MFLYLAFVRIHYLISNLKYINLVKNIFYFQEKRFKKNIKKTILYYQLKCIKI